MPKYVLDGVNYGRDLDANVSKNFKYWEFVSSITAVRHGIANVPTEAEWKNIEYLVKEVVQPLREKVGAIDISSGFRCKKLNDLAGSSDTSFHRRGAAVDLEPKECSLAALLQIANDMEYSEMIAEYFPHGWVHIAYIQGDTRKLLKLKDVTHNFSRMKIEDILKIYGGK